MPPLPGLRFRVELFSRGYRLASWVRTFVGDLAPLHVPPPLRVPVTVLDRKTKQAVAGARISLGRHDRLVPPRPEFEPWPGHFSSTGSSWTTDAQGRALVTTAWSRKDAASPCDVMVEAPGYARAVAGWNDAKRSWPELPRARVTDGRTQALVVRLDPGVCLAGSIVGSASKPSTVVAELWYRENSDSSIVRLFPRARTDASGKYRIDGIGRGWTRLRVFLVRLDEDSSKPPVSALSCIYSADVTDPRRDIETTFDLDREREATFAFSLPNGAPARHAYAVGCGQFQRSSPLHPLDPGVVCDRRGRCRIRSPLQKLSLAVYESRHFVETEVDMEKPRSVQALSPAAAISGRVVDSSGRAVPGAWVAIARSRHRPRSSVFLPTRSAHNELSLGVATDEGGRFEMFFVPGTSEYRLSAWRLSAKGQLAKSAVSDLIRYGAKGVELRFPEKR